MRSESAKQGVSVEVRLERPTEPLAAESEASPLARADVPLRGIFSSLRSPLAPTVAWCLGLSTTARSRSLV